MSQPARGKLDIKLSWAESTAKSVIARGLCGGVSRARRPIGTVDCGLPIVALCVDWRKSFKFTK